MILLQGQPGAGGGSQMVMMVLIMGVFFVFMIWPQMRKQKKAKAYMESLVKGDKIVTTGGIHGKITSVTEGHFVIEMEEGKAKIEKSAVSMELTQAAYPQAAS
ncbi:MAG: preprotein translocase subunit YajC [Bacteroidota bacterium]|jgi:preprotein translocase subunit YajC